MQCSFNPLTGLFAPTAPVVVTHERCWSVAPAGSLAERSDAGGIDSDWLAAVVGLDSFATRNGAASTRGGEEGDKDGTAAPGELVDALPAVVSLGCGIELRGAPGLLKLTLSSGEGARNGYQEVEVVRSWVGDYGDAGCSVFTEVQVMDDTTGDD